MNEQQHSDDRVPGRRQRSRQGAAERRRRVADAALEVLASEGARGLTHRAVDRAAGLPEGSTSNVFRSRAALLEGALERHAELDMPAAADGQLPEPGSLTREEVRELLLAAVAHVLEPGGTGLIVARYELLLESTRRPELRKPLARARARFLEVTAALLEGGGCEQPEAHAAQLLALLDGVLLDRLHGEASALNAEAIAGAVDRMLSSC